MDDPQDELATDPVEAALSECLDAHPLEWADRVRAAAQRAPELSRELQRRFQLLVGDFELERAVSPAGEPSCDARDEPNPRTIGEFVLVDRLGSGGMGVVYRARQPSLHREVALKTIHTGRPLDAAARERLKTEAEAVARLDHVGVLPVHTYGETDGEPWIAMPLFDGVTLQTVLRRLAGRDPQSLTGRDLLEAVNGSSEAPDPMAELFQRDWVYACIAIGAQVARALHHAHGRGVLHRDVKPSNIMLGRDGRAVLIDFGLARIVRPDQDRLTRTGTAIGTLIYMAPERVLGQSDASVTSDVYGLGATLHELLTLQTPFEGDSSAAMKAATLHDVPPPIRPRNRRVSTDVETVVQTARAVHAGERYRDARALAEDCENLLAHRSILARRPPAYRRAWRWMQRHPAVSTGAVAALALIVGGPVALHVVTARSRDAALERADETQHILEYSLDLLRTRPRFGKGGEESTVLELIEKGIDGLDDDFEGTPAARERLRSNFAHALRAHGQYARALAMYEMTLSADLASDPRGGQLRAWALFGSAFALRSLGRPDEALARIEQAADLAEASFAPKDEELADHLMGVAKIYLGSTRSLAGVTAARRALQHIRSYRPEDGLREARALAVLAQAHAEAGQPVEAVRELEEAVPALRKFAPNDELDLAQAILRLGNAAMQQGDLDRAAELFREGREAAARLQGETGDLTLAADSSLASLLLQRDETDAAMRLLEPVALRMLEHHGDSPIVAPALFSLMQGLERQRRIPDLVQKSEDQDWLARFEAAWGDGNATYGTACQKVAFQALAIGRFDVAARALERFIDHNAQFDELRALEIQSRMALASVLEYELKDIDRALEAYRAAREALDGTSVRLVLAPGEEPVDVLEELDAAVARTSAALAAPAPHAK